MLKAKKRRYPSEKTGSGEKVVFWVYIINESHFYYSTYLIFEPLECLSKNYMKRITDLFLFF